MAPGSTAAARTMSGRAWALLLALAFIWGGSFFFNSIGLRALPPLTLVWLRLAIAAAALLLAVRVAGQHLPQDRRAWTALFGLALINNALPFALIVWGQQSIPSGLASILNATTPLWGVLVAHALTRDERLTPLRGLGAALGFAGAVVMVGPDALAGLGAGTAAQLACLAAALCYAFGTVLGRRFTGIPPLAMAASQAGAATLLLLPLMLAAERPWRLPMPGAGVWGAMLALGVLCTALAYVLYFRILATAGATNLLLVTFLVPVSAILLGVLALGETLRTQHLAGMALIGLGLACIDGRLPRRAMGRWSGRWESNPHQ